MVKVIPQLKAVISDSAKKSMFYNPIKNIPTSFSVDDKNRLTTAYENAIMNLINPTYKKLLDFIEKDYLPNTRETVGLLALPNGRDAYTFRVKSRTHDVGVYRPRHRWDFSPNVHFTAPESAPVKE